MASSYPLSGKRQKNAKEQGKVEILFEICVILNRITI